MKSLSRSVIILPAVLGVAVIAQNARSAEPDAVPPIVAVKPGLATKTVWASGLRTPQGMARDRSGNIYVAEYSGGQIAKFAANGKPLAKIGNDLKSPAWIERVGDTLYVSERKANRLLKLDAKDRLTPVVG